LADEVRNAWKGIKSNPTQAEELEAALKDSPDDLEVTCKLLGYYMSNRFMDPKGLQKYREHVLFTIKTFPDNKIAGTLYAQFDREMDGEAAYQAAKQLWLDQVQKNPNNEMILNNAFQFLRDETEVANDIKQKLAQLKPASLKRTL